MSTLLSNFGICFPGQSFKPTRRTTRVLLLQHRKSSAKSLLYIFLASIMSAIPSLFLPLPRPPTRPRKPPGSELFCKERDNENHQSDKELLETGYLSDCTVICQDSKWATHKAILCSRSTWFRLALDGFFKEGSTGVVTIRDTNPDVIQVILEIIYSGETRYECSTPTKIVEIWKAADFFSVRDVMWRAEDAMSRRLEASARFLSGDLKPQPANGCDALLVYYDSCGHGMSERRSCAVRSVWRGTVLHLREPDGINRRHGWCHACHVREGEPGYWLPGQSEPPGQDQDDNTVASPYNQLALRVAPRSESRTRNSIETEIRELCDALALATAGTPLGSRIQKVLIDHLCSTRVEAWGGITVCTFLES